MDSPRGGANTTRDRRGSAMARAAGWSRGSRYRRSRPMWRGPSRP